MANKERQIERTKKRRLAGLCKQCPNSISPRSTVLCNKCLNKNRDRWRKMRYKQHREAYDQGKLRYSSIKTTAKQRGLLVDMSRDEFASWYNGQSKVCYYCGVSEAILKATKRKKSLMTVDRKDNASGYTMDNICLACHRCNNLKSNFFTESQWLDIANRYIVPRLGEYHKS